MTGEDAVYDAAFKRAGIVRVDTIQDLFGCAELMAKQPRPRGSRLTILTNGGGPGVMAADTLARFGLDPVPLTSETILNLDAFLPSFWSRNNPIDILGDASVDRFRRTLEVCLDAKHTDGVCVIIAPQALTDTADLAGVLVSMMEGRRFPVFACWLGGKRIEKAVEILNRSGIPTYGTPEQAVRAFLYMVEYARNMESLMEIPPKLTTHITFDPGAARLLLAQAPLSRFMSESDAKDVLSAYGLPVIRTELADSEEEASRLGRALGYPLAMKLRSPDVTHKTEVGGVRLDLRSDTDVREAFAAIVEAAGRHHPEARIEGVMIQPFFANPDYEILLGAKRDAHFGPVILFGMGGIFTEVLKDRSLGLPPMNRLLARCLMQETKAWTLLQGYRNRPPANLEQLEEMIIRLSQLLIDFPEIAELDMNPVLIKNGQAVTVDARILVSEAKLPYPLHLVISPYPAEHESHLVTEEGTRLFIRPIKPEDAPLLQGLFKVLSPTSIYNRFFCHITALSPEMLARCTQIDYDREIALVALDDEPGAERMMGVARIIGDPDGKAGEFAVLVGDPWHEHGIGSSLLERCLAIAEKRGYQMVSGIVLSENRSMLALGKKLGFQMKQHPGLGELELLIRFK
jgi:acetyltransferase